ncbi:MAG: hypothetical protein HY875_13945 [Chloroflexi bacterium]|nr:hypothetical protein [Chloroflexota bacterium]
MAVSDPIRGRERIEAQLDAIGRLRGSGPNPFDYNQWDDRTVQVIAAVFGADSPELEQYQQAAGTRGRLPGVRGQGENMTLNIHGPWGIRSRLDRAEAVLRALAARLA